MEKIIKWVKKNFLTTEKQEEFIGMDNQKLPLQYFKQFVNKKIVEEFQETGT